MRVCVCARVCMRECVCVCVLHSVNEWTGVGWGGVGGGGDSGEVRGQTKDKVIIKVKPGQRPTFTNHLGVTTDVYFPKDESVSDPPRRCRHSGRSCWLVSIGHIYIYIYLSRIA